MDEIRVNVSFPAELKRWVLFHRDSGNWASSIYAERFEVKEANTVNFYVGGLVIAQADQRKFTIGGGEGVLDVARWTNQHAAHPQKQVA